MSRTTRYGAALAARLFVALPAAADHVDLPRGQGRLAIEGTTIVFTPAGAARGVATKGTHGAPLGLAASGDGSWAFAIFDGSGGRAPEVVLIDLNTRSVWEVFRLAARPTGLSMAP